mmetsp:Transcript_85116/g.237499  ORF Transcript_85116/g.237499 Transcript_85116/m.237499 type:complete len:251 (+) Transcript_85116:1392-2144(+)
MHAKCSAVRLLLPSDRLMSRLGCPRRTASKSMEPRIAAAVSGVKPSLARAPFTSPSLTSTCTAIAGQSHSHACTRSSTPAFRTSPCPPNEACACARRSAANVWPSCNATSALDRCRRSVMTSISCASSFDTAARSTSMVATLPEAAAQCSTVRRRTVCRAMATKVPGGVSVPPASGSAAARRQRAIDTAAWPATAAACNGVRPYASAKSRTAAPPRFAASASRNSTKPWPAAKSATAAKSPGEALGRARQ